MPEPVVHVVPLLVLYCQLEASLAKVTLIVPLLVMPSAAIAVSLARVIVAATGANVSTVTVLDAVFKSTLPAASTIRA